MILKGQLIAESPIYRGNSRKTLFTRDGDGKAKLVSLAGEISGTAQSLMDAFIGKSGNGKNIGLINKAWRRLYTQDMPDGLVQKVDCKLKKECYPRNNFFDMRMGMRLDEDRWASEANANYKLETVLKNSVFDMIMTVNDSLLNKDDNKNRLNYLLKEIIEGRFWFGAGKSKGLGRLKLEMSIPFADAAPPAKIQQGINHLTLHASFSAENPVLVGWNWGKIDPQTTSFASIQASLLIESMKNIPEIIRKRMELAVGGPILNPTDWKNKFSDYLPRVIGACLSERSSGESVSYVITAAALDKLSKGKHGLSPKLLEKIKPHIDKSFASLEDADAVFSKALGKKANMSKRITAEMEKRSVVSNELDQAMWDKLSSGLGLSVDKEELTQVLDDQPKLQALLVSACQKIMPDLMESVDQQIRLIQSDAWVDMEIENRRQHLQIKKMLRDGKITEYQWNDSQMAPQGVSADAWREFLSSHSKVRFRHILNVPNLNKSIVNDENQIAFLQHYRDRVRQELARPEHIDFRSGGDSNNEISQVYGKPYDTVFMRMLTWHKSESGGKEGWQVYIPGGTLKGAFRKRASQVLKTLWGESRETQQIISRMFGEQGRQGLILFSDAYLVEPESKQRWCSMDGVRMNPKTGEPIETAKRDYLCAYGKDMNFQLRLDIQDIKPADMEILDMFKFLLADFQQGEIPIGGEKTNGFGWVKSSIDSIEWLCTDKSNVYQAVAGNCKAEKHGIWNRVYKEGEAAAELLQPNNAIKARQEVKNPIFTNDGFISHRMFGGHCGVIQVALKTLTPTNIKESGEPTETTVLQGHPVNGWDFFSMSPPNNAKRGTERVYAVPSRTLKGLIRHIYSITSDSKNEGQVINRLNQTEKLFGWVGNGPNQALMGRLSFSLALFDSPQLTWYKAPYPYGTWSYDSGDWKQKQGGLIDKHILENSWRLFKHAPLAPIVKPLEGFQPDDYQAAYFRAIVPGCKAKCSIRFWNLTDEELQRLLWCIQLEDGLAHKIGNHRHLGFGSVKLTVLPDSYLIKWSQRYAALKEPNEWQVALNAADFINVKCLKHYTQVKTALNASAL